MQRVRDEAHRFAITFHRQKRSKAMTVSALDEIPGLGPAKQKALLKHFGSVKKLRAASAEEILEVNGFGPAMAVKVAEALGGRESAVREPVIDTETGELLD